MPDIDEHIRRAMEDGQFDNLPGKGKKLPLDENPHADPEWRQAHRMLHNAGFSLPWIELRQEIERESEAARLALQRAWDHRQSAHKTEPERYLASDNWRRAQETFRQAVMQINKKISDYNLQAPSGQLQMRRLDANIIINEIQQDNPPPTE